MSDRGQRGRGGQANTPRSRGPGRSRGGDSAGFRGSEGSRGRGRGSVQERGQDRGGSRGQDRGGFRGQNRGGSRGQDRGGSRGQDRGDFRGRGRGGTPRGPIEIFGQGHPVPDPNDHVRRIEDETFTSTSITSLSALSVGEAPPRRPGYGTQGHKIVVHANYFEVLPSKDQIFIKYSVTVNPVGKVPQPKGKKLAQCVRLLLEKLPQTGGCVVTDLSSTLISNTTLGFEERGFSIAYRSEDENEPTPNSHKYVVTVKRTGTVDFGELLEYLSSTELGRSEPTSKLQIIQAADIVVGFGLKNNQGILTKRNQYFPFDGQFAEGGPLVVGLEVFRGFFASIRTATGRILLNVQVKHVATYESMPLTVLLEKLGADGASIIDQEKFIRRLKVKVTHFTPPRTKIITGFAHPGDGRGTANRPQVPRHGATAGQVRFHDSSQGKLVSVAQYFKRQYQMNVGRIVVNVGDKGNPIYIPSEVCIILPGQEFGSKLSPLATAAMIKFAVRPPAANATSITTKGIELFSNHSNHNMQAFGMSISKSLITVSARVRNSPDINYRGNKQPVPIRDGSWNMANQIFNSGAGIQRWSFVWITTEQSRGAFRNLDEVHSCVISFRDMMNKCGMAVDLPMELESHEIQLRNSNAPAEAIEAFFQNLANIDNHPEILLVILPYQDTKIYNAVKVAGDIKTGLATVDVIGTFPKFAKGLTRDNSQYLANVALKFNLKCGGKNQQLKPAGLGFLGDGITMLVGIDVTHPQPGAQENAPSIAGVVASSDRYLGQWPADVRIQKGREEMVVALQEMLESRLLHWRKVNGRLPREILVYRDGVSESQYKDVREKELPCIRAACQKLYPADQTKAEIPSITIIICGKRHHTRFYPTQEKDADPRTGGTRSGTVVDRGVTESRVWDFYVQPHAALQGTPRPCHYVVMHDEIFRRRAAQNPRGQSAADMLESMTHNLCYMFGRATKAVSLCPPAYYADLLCERARRWISRVYDDSRTTVSGDTELAVQPDEVRVHPRLENTMFYI